MSLVIDSNTRILGGVPATASGHTLSLPNLAANGEVVKDRTTTALGKLYSTVGETGMGPSHTSCPVQQIFDGQLQDLPCSGSQTTSINTNTNIIPYVFTDANMNVNTITNTRARMEPGTVNIKISMNAGTETFAGNTRTNTSIQTILSASTSTKTGSDTHT